MKIVCTWWRLSNAFSHLVSVVSKLYLLQQKKIGTLYRFFFLKFHFLSEIFLVISTFVSLICLAVCWWLWWHLNVCGHVWCLGVRMCISYLRRTSKCCQLYFESSWEENLAWCMVSSFHLLYSFDNFDDNFQVTWNLSRVFHCHLCIIYIVSKIKKISVVVDFLKYDSKSSNQK